MSLTADEDVDDRAVIEIFLEEIRGYAAFKECSAFLDLLREHCEQVVGFDSFNNLLFVVEREVASDGSRQATSGFFGLDQRHDRLLSFLTGCWRMGCSVGRPL